ncbi:MAG: V-type ATP synthase subunit E [Candidatus Poribacteria bacterium]
MGGVGNIETLRNEILRQAKEQASTIVEREQRIAERDLEYAREDAKAIREQERAKLQPLIETEKKKISSSAEMEARRLLLEKKEELVSRLFADVEHRLEQMRGSDSYVDLIAKSIENGFETIGNELIVEYGEKDKEIFSDSFISKIKSRISKSLGVKMNIEFRYSGNVISAGVIIKSKDGRVVIDDSFSNIIKRLKEELRGKVSEILLQE